MFERLMGQIDYDITHRIFKAQIQTNAPVQPLTPVIESGVPKRIASLTDEHLQHSLGAGAAGDLLSRVKNLGKANTSTSPQPTQKNDLLSSLIKQDSKLVKAADAQIQHRAQGDTSIAKPKIGRNDPCWCGSGKKWKKCHYPAAQ